MKYRVVLYSTEHFEVEIEANSARAAVLGARESLSEQLGYLELSEVEVIGEESE